MKNTKAHNPNVGVKVVAGLIAASQVVSAAETDEEKVESLEPTTVVATKFEKKLSEVSQSVEVLDVRDLEKEGQVSVQNALGYRVPGVISTSTAGQGGQPASIFVRGTTSKYTQIRVDGVSLVDSNGSGIHNYLGTASVFGVSNIEVLKGAASSLYGSGAIGGVVSLNTEKGQGDPTSSIAAEYGSYNSSLANIRSQGNVGDFSYNLGVTSEQTENDSDASINGNDFDQLSYFGRFDYALSNDSSIGLTVRGSNSKYETPQQGDLATNTPQKNEYSSLILTSFYEGQMTELWNTRLTFGLTKEDFDSRGSVYGPTSFFDTNITRHTANWDNELNWSDRHSTVSGAYFVNSKYYSISGFSSGERERNTYGFYANHSWKASERLLVSAGLGWDEHDDYDPETTWNAGFTFDVLDGTILKANVGTAFLAPSFSAVAKNPNLEGERSLSWDVGVEHSVGVAKLQITWFESDIDNKIEGEFGPSPSNSSDKSKASGLEVQFDAPLEAINSTLYATYSYYADRLATEIPEQVALLGVNTQVSETFDVGMTAQWVDEASSTESAFTTKNDLADYFIVNLHANYQVSDQIKVHARIENLLDDDYRLGDFTGPIFGEELFSVKGRGRGFYGGVTVTF